MNKMETQEMISALADGQLRGEAFARGVEAVAGDPAARQAWLAYHVIGDVLRSGELAVGSASEPLVQRVRVRLAEEPAFAVAAVAQNIPQAGAGALPHAPMSAANDGSFRWKMVAGFASLTAVAAIGWTVAGTLDKPEQAQLSVAPLAPPATVLAGSERGVMLRDARLDELLAAHRQLGGASALQAPAGFLRNATFEGPAR
jgi:sigma-E factor negative regulatory protein RseA